MPVTVDTFNDIVGRVKLRCPVASVFICQDWVRNAFRRIVERRRWSWLYGFSQFFVPLAYTTGTVTTTRSSTIVTGSGTAWDSTMIGRQFRIQAYPIYTIQSVQSATQLTLDNLWGGTTASGVSYEIYQCYFPVPNDFRSFISLWDPQYNWQLALDFTQNQLNAADAQRANTGNAYVVAWLDYTSSYVGQVFPPVQVQGTGNDPSSAGSYTGPVNATFTIEITTAGVPGTAVYKWKKDAGSYTTGVTTDSAGAAQDLQDGVQIYFPTGVSYTLADIWVINTIAGSNPGVPRYELWPHQKAQWIYPFLYWKKPPDLSDPTSVLPYMLNGDILLEAALVEAASWPGPSTDKPNPYYRLELADRHRAKYEQLALEAERNDEECYMSDLNYQEATSLPFSPIPALGDSNWLMRHDW